MRKVAIISAVVLSSFVAAEVAARDLLSAGNPVKPVVRAAAVNGATTYPEPFTTTPGQASYVCSISGLGRTSNCVMKSWAERRVTPLRTATK